MPSRYAKALQNRPTALHALAAAVEAPPQRRQNQIKSNG
jgi:hypothetical protein